MISVKQVLEEEARKRQEPIQAPVATPDQNIAEQQPNSSDIQAIGRATSQLLNQRMNESESVPQIAPNETEQQQVIYDSKPQGWDDDQYAAVRSLGYTDEQIAQAFSNPDPNELMNGIYSSVYKNQIPEPQAPDEKTMKRQRNIAGIGDILGMVSQMASSAMGARTRERSWEESASARLSESQKEIYDRYLAESDKYNRELVNAQLQDYLQGKQDWQQTRKNMSDAINEVNKQKIEQAEKEQKEAFEREKFEETKRNNESLRQQREHSMQIAEQNARSLSAYRQSQIAKNNADMASRTSSLSGKKADVTFYLNSEEGDPNAQLDNFGRPIVEYSLSKDEIFSLAQEAKKDSEFMQRNGLILSQPDKVGSGSWRYAPDDEIALAFVQEMYNKQYQEALKGNAPFPQVAIPTPNWDDSSDIMQDPLDTPPYEQQKQDEDEEYINQFLLDN